MIDLTCNATAEYSCKSRTRIGPFHPLSVDVVKSLTPLARETRRLYGEEVFKDYFLDFANVLQTFCKFYPFVKYHFTRSDQMVQQVERLLILTFRSQRFSNDKNPNILQVISVSPL